MRLGYFTMPVHPLQRDPTETLKEDREAIIFADKLGYHDAFVGEHLTDRAENITNSILDDLVAMIQPRRLKLSAAFTPRGGISSTIVVQHPQ